MDMVMLLRLAGPMQSWGVDSRFAWRGTGREPSFSGVIGLLGAALGVPRGDRGLIARLAAWEMGVRVDREGTLLTDYHTAGGGTLGGAPYGVANAREGRTGTVTSVREYLADADFLVALEGTDRELMAAAAAALQAPRWPLYLGRRGFPPACPILVGCYQGTLRQHLEHYPWRARWPGEKPPAAGLRMVLTTREPGSEWRWDHPVSFAADGREYRPRRVLTVFLPAERVVVARD